MPNPEETVHQEGPSVPEMITEVVTKTTSTESLEQFELLTKQIENGEYDGNGPADVAPTDQIA